MRALCICSAVLLLGTAALVAWAVARRPDRLTILVGVAVLALAFFAAPTRVHERYLFPFFGLAAILLAFSWRWAIAYVVAGLATFLNMYVVLVAFYDNPQVSDWLGIGEMLREPMAVVFIALLVILNSVTGWIYSYTIKSFPSPFPAEPIFGHYITSHQGGAIGVTMVVLLLLFLFFRYTPLGLAMRAAAQNPDSARLVGIRVGWMLALGWGLAAAVGGVAGMMVAPIVFLDPNMMGGVLLYAFAAALVGGIDNPAGAVFGGFLMGVLENLLGAFVIGNELKLAVALVIIIGVLVVKPSGFFGKVLVTRV